MNPFEVWAGREVTVSVADLHIMTALAVAAGPDILTRLEDVDAVNRIVDALNEAKGLA